MYVSSKSDALYVDDPELSVQRFSNGTLMMRKLPGNKIFVTGPWVHEQIVKENLQMNPGIEIHVFNNSAMARSVKLIGRELAADEYRLGGAWESWSSLKPLAYCADLWRLMLLWSEGGIYLDSEVKLMTPASDWVTFLPDE